MAFYHLFLLRLDMSHFDVMIVIIILLMALSLYQCIFVYICSKKEEMGLAKRVHTHVDNHVEGIIRASYANTPKAALFRRISASTMV